MSTSHQMAVMLCGWRVKAGMACLQVKLYVAMSDCFRKCIWYLKALYKCPGLLYFTFTMVIRKFFWVGCAVRSSDVNNLLS